MINGLTKTKIMHYVVKGFARDNSNEWNIKEIVEIFKNHSNHRFSERNGESCVNFKFDIDISSYVITMK